MMFCDDIKYNKLQVSLLIWLQLMVFTFLNMPIHHPTTLFNQLPKGYVGGKEENTL